MTDKLDVLLADGVIDEVLGRLKSGKEANISLVRRGELVIAAKVCADIATAIARGTGLPKDLDSKLARPGDPVGDERAHGDAPSWRMLHRPFGRGDVEAYGVGRSCRRCRSAPESEKGVRM